VLGEPEALEQLVGAASGDRAGEVVEAPDHLEIRRPLIRPSTVACWAATPMRLRTRAASSTTS
jgi:hypothetical protein